MKCKTLTIIVLLLAFVSVAYAVDFDKSTVFLSDADGGNITFAQDITANQVQTPVNNQVRFTNLTYGSYNFGNIGFRATNTSLTMNITSINSTDVTVTITQSNNTIYELWFPSIDPVTITGADSSIWNATSDTLFVTMDANGTFNVNFEEIIPPPEEYIIDYFNGTLAVNYKLADEHASDSAEDSAQAQAFTVTQPANLTKVQFYLKKVGTPTGSGRARIYAITGTYGTSAEPTGAVLAYSDPFDWTTLTTTSQWVTLNFTDENQIYLTEGHYAIVITADLSSSVSGTRYIAVGTGIGHDGNLASYENGAWDTSALRDLLFYVYGQRDEPTISVSSDSEFTRDEYGLLNVTVNDPQSADDIEYINVQFNSSGDTNNFTLRWDRITGFSEISDPDNICTANLTSCVKSELNNTAIFLMLNFTITGGQQGNYDVNVTAPDYGGLTTTSTFSNQFVFTYYNWGGAVYDLINSAFAFFGVIDFMTQIQTAITGLVGYFSSSLTNVVALIQAQFTIITNVFPWFLRWFVRIVNRIVAMGAIMVSIFNGTHDIMTGLGSLWDLVQLSAWTDIIVLLVIFAWIESIIRRGRTQGEIQVFLGDLQTVMNILGYFMNMFMTVINFIVDYTFRLFEAII